MTPKFGRHLVAEAVGTGFLTAAVVGSGIAAHRLSPNEKGLQLLENALTTGVVLAALILGLGQVSAAFNPVASMLTRVLFPVPAARPGLLVRAAPREPS